jgi:RNA polymerase sigma factor (sigma-70 family)
MPRSAVALARLAAPTASPTPDAQLLRAFLASQQDDAFAELVRRHGPMVLAACRRVLGDLHDAEDAFQATFLVLARKAGAVRGTNVAGWLYAVAVRTARGVRVMRDRRKKHSARSQETEVRSQRTDSSPSPEPSPDSCLLVTEQAAIIDEELAKLPEHFREAIVLCELRGLSRKLAAAELGIPEGTLSSRLAGAKRKLAEALTRRGVAVPAALAALLAPATVSAGLLQSTAAAVRGAAGSVANAAAGAVVKGMLFDQLKAVALTAGLLVGAVCGGLAMTGPPNERGSDPATPAPRPPEDPAAKLVQQLGSADFARREAAHEALRKLGPKAEPALKAALKSDDPEVRTRAVTLLSEIRKDALDDLAKNFDPKAESPSDHPIWKRFKAIAGDTRASRELFARIIKDADWRRRLDAAEAGPEAAARQYREAIIEVGRHVLSNSSVWFVIYVWPCDTPDQTAYLLLLGSHPGTESARPEKRPDEEHYALGEGQLTAARGLNLGLEGKEIVPGPKNHYDQTAAMTPGTDRVFARLLGAWLPRRTDPSVLYSGFELAVKHRAAEVLPAARAVAANKQLTVKARCGALLPIAQFGTPADLPLFVPLFDDDTLLVLTPPPKPGVSPGPRSRRLHAHDQAIALALLLCDQDPYEFGFAYAKDRFRRDNGRPVIANYELERFGFPDDKSRTAAHAKAKAFLDRQPKEKPKRDETFEEQVKKAEAEVKKLGLVDVASFGDGIDTKFPIVFEGKGGKVSVKAGSAVLVELPKPTKLMAWQTGGFKPEAVGDEDGPEFTHVLCKWTADGKLTWVMYRKPTDKEIEKEKPDPAVAKLVEQLGSDEFAVREAAHKELRKLGLKAEAALRAGLKSEDPEVRARCAKILAEIRKDSLDDLVRTFDPKAESVPDHPIWKRFKSIAGDTRASRELFAQVIADSRLARFLDAAEAVPADRARIYRDEVAWQSCNATYAVAGQMPGGYRMLEGGPKASELKPPPEPVTSASLAAYFFLGSYPETAVQVTGKDRAGRAIREGLIVETFEFAKGQAPPAVRKLFAVWLDNRVDRDTLESGYWRATANDIPDAAPAARRLLAAKELPSAAKAYAALYLARRGEKADVALITPLLDDTTVARAVIYDKPAPVQVRDAALAACLLLHDENPADYGFDVLRKRGSPKADAFDMAWLGFWSDAARDAAHEKGRDWLDKQR